MKPIAILRGHRDAIVSIVIVNNILVSFSRDGSIFKWDLETKKSIVLCTVDEIRHGAVWNNSILYSNNSRFAKLDMDGNELCIMKILPSVCNFSICNDNAIISKLENVEIIDLNSFTSTIAFKPEIAPTALLMTEKEIIIGCDNGSVIRYDYGFNLLQEYTVHVENISALLFDDTLYSGGTDYFLTQYTTQVQQILLPMNGTTCMVKIHHLLYIGTWKGIVAVDIGNGDIKSAFNGGFIIHKIVVDKNKLYACGEDKRIYIFEI